MYPRLKRRFQTAQEDVSYTVLALLPTLAEQIMQGMDVESLTQELQARSRARNATPGGLQQQMAMMMGQRYAGGDPGRAHEREGTQPSLGSSMVHVDPVRDLEVGSEAGSTASTSYVDASASLRDGESNSWMEASASGRSPHSPPSPKDDGALSQLPNGPQLSDSVLTMTTESSVDHESRLVRLSHIVTQRVVLNLWFTSSRIAQRVCLPHRILRSLGRKQNSGPK